MRYSTVDRGQQFSNQTIMKVILAVLTAAVAGAGCATTGPPPSARTVDVVDDYHGVKVRDPYRWLENGNNPEVAQWVEAQNAYTRAYLDRVPERAAIVDRLERLYSAATVSAPSVVKDRYFFRRRESGQNHAVLYVREGSYNAPARVLIDPNTFSEDGTVALDWTSVSPDGGLIAYGKSSSGDEKSTLYIKDICPRGFPERATATSRGCRTAGRFTIRAIHFRERCRRVTRTTTARSTTTSSATTGRTTSWW